ncbi:MAG: DUF4139 domain-containing protein [Magnetococcales bacterium]|nr:DUF4139 domain-containing protein [Magnetococcales bacterium]
MKIISSLLSSACVLAFASWFQVHGEELSATALPVKSVALFSSGVGYFQHAGSVNGSTALTLYFKESQINDLLKSLVVEDLDGGTPGSVAYPSQAPLDRVLKEFQVDLNDNPGLLTLLDQMRGSRITARLSDGAVTGIVIGTEIKSKFNQNNLKEEEWILNLLEGSILRPLPLQEVRQIDLLDNTLKRDLENALKTLDQSRGQDRKAVNLSLAGEGKRRIRIGYVVEAPLWKTSYRLLLGQQVEQNWLQGWAIVENQTETDWEKVSVSLVSGKPISFIQNLYRSQYSVRQQVGMDNEPPPPPPVYETGGGRAMEKAMARPEPRPSAAPAPRRAMPKSLSSADMETSWQEELPDPSQLTANAAASEVGELYQFKVDGITLPRRQAAMLPIISAPVQAEKVTIYNSTVNNGRPLHGILLHNTSGHHLPAGPITLFDSGVYAGDSRIKDVPIGDKRLLSYAVDLEVQVMPSRDQISEEIIAGRFRKGLLILTHKHQARKEYKIINKYSRDKQIILEHPLRSGWKMVSDKEPFESTEQWHRFRMNVAGRGESSFEVREERVAEQTMAILDAGFDFLNVTIKNAAIAQPVRQAMEKVAGKKWELDDSERRLQEVESELDALHREQERVRANIQVLRPASPQHDQMTKKLLELENTIDKRLASLENLRGKRDGQRKALEEMLAGLTIE